MVVVTVNGKEVTGIGIGPVVVTGFGTGDVVVVVDGGVGVGAVGRVVVVVDTDDGVGTGMVTDAGGGGGGTAVVGVIVVEVNVIVFGEVVVVVSCVDVAVIVVVTAGGSGTTDVTGGVVDGIVIVVTDVDETAGGIYPAGSDDDGVIVWDVAVCVAVEKVRPGVAVPAVAGDTGCTAVVPAAGTVEKDDDFTPAVWLHPLPITVSSNKTTIIRRTVILPSA